MDVKDFMVKELPVDWIDRIFIAMEGFYGERWTSQFKRQFEIDLYKTIWFNSLNGLSYAEIRHGLAVSKDYSKIKTVKPPNHIRFYHYCIKTIYPLPKSVPRRTPFVRKKS